MSKRLPEDPRDPRRDAGDRSNDSPVVQPRRPAGGGHGNELAPGGILRSEPDVGDAAAPPRQGTEIPATTLLTFVAFSVASGLFFFGCLKLMNFHWLPMNVLVSFLLVGMPIGGFLSLRFLRADLVSLSHGLALQMVGMLVALALFPLLLDPASRIDRLLLGRLGDAAVLFTLTKFAQLTLVFGLYFIAFGMNEFLGYRLALPIVGHRSERAYALFLAGTSLAYVVLEFGSPRLGVVPLMVSGVGAIGLAASALRHRFLGRGRVLAVVSLLLVVAAWVPGFEDRYITALELEGPLQLRTLRHRPGVELLYRRWGRYCHLSVMALSETAITGFYNGGLHWFHRLGRTRDELETSTIETVPFSTLRPGAKVLIIGVGGGEQVRTALMFEPAKVVAVEIIPDVLRVLGGPLADRVGHVYGDPRVVPVAMDGRRYLERTDERFDLIFLPVVDTSITMMRSLFNPAEMLYTVEAFDSMRRHLTDDGLLVIQRPAYFDQHGAMMRQYFRELADLGMSPFVWLNNPAALAGADGKGMEDPAFSGEGVYLIFGRSHPTAGVLPASTEASLRRRGYFRADGFGDFPYLPKTDDFLFRSDMLAIMLGRSQLNRDVATLVVGTLLVVLIFAVLLRRLYGDAASSRGAPFWVLFTIGVLVGLNFLLLEQLFIFKLIRILPRPIDAMFVGTVGFILVTATCGVALTRREGWFVAVLVLAVAAAGALATRVVVAETPTGLLAALPLAAMSGALFPTVFRGGDRRLLVVFAADGLGAVAGGLAAFLWPIAFGFRSFDLLTFGVFTVTAITVLWARRRWQLVAA